jgi:predicted ATP-grasp superfamily ATP-dependent carboligase
LYSHELHLQFNIDQGKVRNDAAKLKKESEKARKALRKENEKKRKEKQRLLVVIVKLPPPLPTRMNFLQ